MDTKESLIEQYQKHLTRAGKSAKTVKAYCHDLAAFIRWWEPTTGEAFDPQAVDPREIRGYSMNVNLKVTHLDRLCHRVIFER